MDNITRGVQKRSARKKRAPDRRVEKTRRSLHAAIASLVHEKDYDEIVVKEILSRANIGRSTFYTHFRTKDELLESAIREVVRTAPSRLPTSAAPSEAIIAFSLPVLEYVDQRRRLCGSRIGMKASDSLHEQRLQPALADLIAGEVRSALRTRPQAAGQIPVDVLSQHIAATFVLVLNWWTRSASALGPNQVGEVFRALIVPTLDSLLG